MPECISVAVVTAAVTALLGWTGRRRLIRVAVSSEDLMRELQHRGYDLEHHAMESYVQRTFRIIGKLGQGASGEVWRVERRLTREVLAMKRIRKNHIQSGVNDQASLATEIACLRKLRHRHIVNLVEVIESDKTLWIVMECADGGGLYDRIMALNHFSERSAARIIKQVLKAVHYMHSMGIVHRDLKLENVLLESSNLDADVKIADFGLAVELGFEGFHPEESMRMKKSRVISGSFVGSPICMAPEVSQHGAAYGPQCDVWSVGCMAHELVCGHPPFTAASADELFRIVRESDGPSFCDQVWLTVSHEGKALVRWMLQKRPEDRPSAKEALNHAWFMDAPDQHNEGVQGRIRTRLSQRGVMSPSVSPVMGFRARAAVMA